MNKFYIGHTDNPDFFVSAVHVDDRMLNPIRWTMDRERAIKLEEEECEALVKFVCDAIDFELSECLVMKPAEYYDEE